MSDDTKGASGAASVTVTAQPGDVMIALSEGAFATVKRIAALKGVSVGQAVSDALALQEAVETEKSTGGRLLIERHGDVEELAG